MLAGREQEAAKSLKWLRGPATDIHQELATLRDNILASRACQPSTRHTMSIILHPILITCGLMFFQR